MPAGVKEQETSYRVACRCPLCGKTVVTFLLPSEVGDPMKDRTWQAAAAPLLYRPTANVADVHQSWTDEEGATHHDLGDGGRLRLTCGRRACRWGKVLRGRTLRALISRAALDGRHQATLPR